MLKSVLGTLEAGLKKKLLPKLSKARIDSEYKNIHPLKYAFPGALSANAPFRNQIALGFVSSDSLLSAI